VTSKTFPLTRSVVQRLQLGDLASQLSGVPGVGTLYIPAVAERPIEDAELMEVMETTGIDAPVES
jgi:hypothetical protein